MGVSYPSRLGGSISASDSDSISTELSVDGLPLGTKVFNQDVGAFFTLKLSTASLVTDEVLQVLGIAGARWIIDPSVVSSVSTDDTLTGDGTDGDPLSVVTSELTSATTTIPGIMAINDKGQVRRAGTDLTNSDQTVQPGTDKCGVYFIRPGTLTTGRVITIGDTGSVAGDWVMFVVQQVLGNFNNQFNDAAATPLKTFNCETNGQARAYLFAHNGTHWTFNTTFWVD